MTINFYFPRYKTKKKEKTIFCYVREKGKEICLNTGCKSNPEHWDKERQRLSIRKAKSSVEKSRYWNINKILDAYENKIYDITYKIRSNNPTAKFETIANAIKNHFNKKDDSFFGIYDEFLKIKSAKISTAAIQKYKRLKSLLKEYEKENRIKLDFDKITNLFFEKFFLFLITKKRMLNNSAHKTIQFLKTFMIWANDNGYTDNKSYKTFKSKAEQNEVIYLTEDELMKLYNMEIEDERLSRVRDLFAFQCFTGVRYSDIKNIAHEDIRGATWYLRTQKTHQILEIPLSSYALSILAKYKDYPQPLPAISNQKMNLYVKELCKLAGIDTPVKIVKFRGKERIEKVYKKYEVIGTHTARRTFISLSLEKGMKAEVIMAITGHTTYRMMQKYLKIADEQKRTEVDMAWGSPLRQIK